AWLLREGGIEYVDLGVTKIGRIQPALARSAGDRDSQCGVHRRVMRGVCDDGITHIHPGRPSSDHAARTRIQEPCRRGPSACGYDEAVAGIRDNTGRAEGHTRGRGREMHPQWPG